MNYQEELTYLFVLFIKSNYKKDRIFLTKRELFAHEKGIKVTQLILLLAEAQLLPIKITFDLFIDICYKTISYGSDLCNKFYSNKELKEFFLKCGESSVNYPVKIPGDFEIPFSEFVLIMTKVRLFDSKNVVPA